MASPIRTNKPVFFGNNAEPLKNGYIYIGNPNTDPTVSSNQKTVTFRDAGGSEFTAPQPLRTGSDGRIIYEANGKPIVALVDGNYSMLVLDNTGAEIKNGYTPLIDNTTTPTASNNVLYASLLVDLKALNVTPGQYVENIGKTSSLDGEGARWLVVSNTGNPADDLNLIDFDNGTQGKRVENQLYTLKSLQEIEDAGSSARAEARENIDVYSITEVDNKINNPTNRTLVQDYKPAGQTTVDYADLDGDGLYYVRGWINNDTIAGGSYIYIVDGEDSSAFHDSAATSGDRSIVFWAQFEGSTNELVILGQISDGTFTSREISEIYKLD